MNADDTILRFDKLADLALSHVPKPLTCINSF
jgi:hypothetical protein